MPTKRTAESAFQDAETHDHHKCLDLCVSQNERQKKIAFYLPLSLHHRDPKRKGVLFWDSFHNIKRPCQMMQMSHNQRLTLKPYPDSFLLFLLHSSKLSIVLCLQLHQKESNQSRDRCGERICLNNGEARVDDRVPIVLNCIHGAERCDQGATTERFGTESARSLVTEREATERIDKSRDRVFDVRRTEDR